MAYQNMATLYDRLMDHAPYDAWNILAQEVFNLSNKQIKTVADLGCGTGEITLKLAQAGYELYGIDNSMNMLAHAENKGNEQNISIQWLHQDLRNLTGLFNVDAAISFCDVINYITSKEDLGKAFTNIANILRPEGLFIFDVHSMNHVKNNLVNNTFADVGDDFSYIWFCEQGDNQGEMFHDLTFFTLDGNKYNRFNEYHHQRTYPIEFYQQLLTESGFEKAKVFTDFTLEKGKITENTERIFFLTRKK